MSGEGTSISLCRRCKSSPSTWFMRGEPICESCHVEYITQKSGKSIALIARGLRYASSDPRSVRPKYLFGLSLGSSSAGLLHMLNSKARFYQNKKPVNSFDLVVVHIDTDLNAPRTQPSPAQVLLDKYRARFPHLSIDSIPVSSALELDTVDWSALPHLQTELEPMGRLRKLFQDLPSVSSRVDLLRLLVRHLLLNAAIESDSHALLLGATTTALAELTLAETAKGRGYAIPCQINDGLYPIPRFPKWIAGESGDQASGGEPGGRRRKTSFPIYFPLRDVFRKEMVQYNATSLVAMTDLVSPDGVAINGSVVSHRELSIEDIMSRYFAEVEASFPSVVANVVRTSEKLVRPTGVACGMCSMPLDDQGDERWKGEIGGDPSDETQRTIQTRLCYGCTRSLRG